MNFSINQTIIIDPITCDKLIQDSFTYGVKYNDILQTRTIYALVSVVIIIFILIFMIEKVRKSLINKSIDLEKLKESVNFQLTLLYFSIMMFMFMVISNLLVKYM